jgi:hypothetical protein
MARVTPKGLYVWDLTTDAFNHAQLAANWDLVDSLLGASATSVETLSAIPGSGNFAGRLVMLSTASGGFPAWSLIRFDGSAWRTVSATEILPVVPSSGNYAGRTVVLSGADSGFVAWDTIRYNGTTWDYVGPWLVVNTGAGATNIKGVQQAGDVYINASTRGVVLVDRTLGTKFRIFFDNGTLGYETVT